MYYVHRTLSFIYMYNIDIMSTLSNILFINPFTVYTLDCATGLLGADLEELGVLVHDVEEDVVDVAAQLRVDVLLLLQRLPHLVF